MFSGCDAYFLLIRSPGLMFSGGGATKAQAYLQRYYVAVVREGEVRIV